MAPQIPFIAEPCPAAYPDSEHDGGVLMTGGTETQMAGKTAMALRRCLRLAVAGLFLATAPLMARAAETPASITVVTDDNYPPYVFRSYDGTLHGILKDYWDLWSEKTGIKVNLRAMDWAKALTVMATGEADVIDTIFETAERRSLYDFSAPYVTIDVPIFFHKSISGISDVDTLRGFTIGVKDGDACVSWLEERGLTTLKRYSSYEVMVEAASNQDIRIFCLDQPPATYLLIRKGLDSEFRHTPPLYSGQFHWAVRKGDQPTYKIVADGFARISQDERQRVWSKWQGTSLSQQDHRALDLVTLGLEIAAGGALILGIWAWILRRQVRERAGKLVVTLEALSQSDKHYRELLSLTPVGVFETSPQGACTFVNERWFDITGWPKDYMHDVPWHVIVAPEDRPDILHRWTDAARESRPFQAEFRIQAQNRPIAWILGQLSPRFDEQGRLLGHIGTITDISAAKAAEAALAVSESRFRTIFDNINDAIFIHALDTGTILAVNQRMVEMYGYDQPSDVIGLAAGGLSEGVPPYDGDAAMGWLVKARAGEPQLFEWRARTRNNQLFWVEVNLRRASIGADQDVILVVVRDISERKQAELVLTERTEALERSNADLEQFAYVASHDLREPLRMISSYMALLERRYGDRLEKDGHEFIAFAKEGAVRMDRLVQDLLEFSRVGRVADPPVATPLDMVLTNVLKVLATIIRDAGARIEIPTPLPTVLCSGNEIFLLFQNLISNAIKFRAPGRAPVVRITAERQNTGWLFAVADNGIGIDSNYYDRIFKIFQRLHTRDKYEGTGIGLSICKKIVERHGGRIWVTSVSDEGTTFCFTLPDVG